MLGTFTSYQDEELELPAEVPIFPMPQTVLLPGEPMPLHIFEHAYREMAEYSLKTSRLLGLAHLKPGWESNDKTEIYDIAGLGKILFDERLPDGEFNLLVMGLKRIKIKQLTQEKPYAKALIDVLSDRFSQTGSSLISSLEEEIMKLSKKFFTPKRIQDPNMPNLSPSLLERFPSEGVPLGMLTDFIAAGVPLAAIEKQLILEEPDVVRRAEKLIFSLRFHIKSEAAGSPPSLLQ